MEEENPKPASETIVGADVRIKGNLKSPAEIKIFGQVKGEVNSETTVFIGEGARIEGNISARNIFISGEVTGNVKAEEKLELASTARLQGDVQTPDLVIESGAKFSGKCEMVDTEMIAEKVKKEGEEMGEEGGEEEVLEELEKTIEE
jgi:cytoskeletal protein CcmA (bactofilin family)